VAPLPYGLQNLLTDRTACGTCSTACSLTDVCNAGVCGPLFASGGLSWATTYLGTLNGNPWSISNDNTRVKFTVERSADCGGVNNNQQLGSATATITVGATAISFDFTLSGIGEGRDAGFDRMDLVFDGVAVGQAASAGGDLGCVDIPVIFTRSGTWPKTLAPGSVHTFEARFDTEDELFHVTSYYQLDVLFTPIV